MMFENPPLAEIVEAAVVGIHDPPDAWGNLLGLIVRHFVEKKVRLSRRKDRDDLALGGQKKHDN